MRGPPRGGPRTLTAYASALTANRGRHRGPSQADDAEYGRGASLATLTQAERSARPVSRRTRRPRAVRARAQPPPPRAPEQTSLDEIVERWWTALGASQSAPRAAQGRPGGRGGLEGVRAGTAERAEVIRLLQGLEHDVHEQSRLLPWLTRASITNRMLGLPAAV